MPMVLAVLGLAARAMLFPWRFSAFRRVSVLSLVVIVLALAVAAAIVWVTDAEGGAFTTLFLALYGVSMAAAIAAFIGLRRLRTRAARTLDELLLLTPTEFETAVARMLRGIGYRDVSVVGGPGDLAADILCRERKGQSVAVQCKRKTPGQRVLQVGGGSALQVPVQCKRKTPGQRVGSAEMQKFIGMISVHHEADVGIFVTTSEFTQPAIDLADRHGITLLDGDSLSKMMRKRERGRPVRPAHRAV